MAKRAYTQEDDRVILCMANKGATNQQIGDLLNRTAESIKDRKVVLRGAGHEIRRAPKVRRANAANFEPVFPQTVEPEPEQVCMAISGESTGPIRPFDITDLDPVSLVGAQIEELTERENKLIAELEKVRSEKMAIFEKLAEMIGVTLYGG